MYFWFCCLWLDLAGLYIISDTKIQTSELLATPTPDPFPVCFTHYLFYLLLGKLLLFMPILLQKPWMSFQNLDKKRKRRYDPRTHLLIVGLDIPSLFGCWSRHLGKTKHQQKLWWNGTNWLKMCHPIRNWGIASCILNQMLIQAWRVTLLGRNFYSTDPHKEPIEISGEEHSRCGITLLKDW